jgi:hypothetical protein
VVARGVARITLNPRSQKMIYAAGDLRAHNSAGELRRGMPEDGLPMDDVMRPASTIQLLDDDIPFGWTPDERP